MTVKNYKSKKYINIFESIYKNGWKNMKFGDTEIGKQNFHQYKGNSKI